MSDKILARRIKFGVAFLVITLVLTSYANSVRIITDTTDSSTGVIMYDGDYDFKNGSTFELMSKIYVSNGNIYNATQDNVKYAAWSLNATYGVVYIPYGVSFASLLQHGSLPTNVNFQCYNYSTTPTINVTGAQPGFMWFDSANNVLKVKRNAGNWATINVNASAGADGAGSITEEDRAKWNNSVTHVNAYDDLWNTSLRKLSFMLKWNGTALKANNSALRINRTAGFGINWNNTVIKVNRTQGFGNKWNQTTSGFNNSKTFWAAWNASTGDLRFIGWSHNWNRTTLQLNNTILKVNRTIGFGNKWNQTTAGFNNSKTFWATWNASTGDLRFIGWSHSWNRTTTQSNNTYLKVNRTIDFGSEWNNTVLKSNRTSDFGNKWNQTTSGFNNSKTFWALWNASTGDNRFLGWSHNWNLTTTQMNKTATWWAGWNATTGGNFAPNVTFITNSRGYKFPVSNVGIQDAIWDLNNTGSGLMGWVELPPCNISITIPIRVPSNTWLRGAGNSSVLYLADGANKTLLVNFYRSLIVGGTTVATGNNSNVKLTDFTINGNQYHQPHHISISNWGWNQGHGMQLLQTHNLTIERVTIENTILAGIYIGACNNVFIQNVKVTEAGVCWGDGLPSGVSENILPGGIWGGACTNVTISHCLFSNYWNHGTCFESISLTGSPSYGMKSKWITISDSLYLNGFSGIWFENGGRATVTNCIFRNMTRQEDVYTTNNEPRAIVLGAGTERVTVSNCLAERCGNISARTGSGFILGGNNNTISDCILNEIYGCGVEMYGDYLTLSNCYINNVTGNDGDDTTGYGIRLTTSTSHLRGVSILNNKINQTSAYGIHLTSAVASDKQKNIGVLVSGNYISCTRTDEDYGIFCGLYNATITDNTITGYYDGIQTWASNGTISGNHISGCGRYGIYSIRDATPILHGGKYNIITGNTISKCTSDGINFNWNFTTVLGNTIKSCGGDGIQIGGSPKCCNNTVTNNMITDCSGYGIRESTTGNYNIIKDNNVITCTATILQSGARSIVRDNIGYNTFFDIVNQSTFQPGYAWFDSANNLLMIKRSANNWAHIYANQSAGASDGAGSITDADRASWNSSIRKLSFMAKWNGTSLKANNTALKTNRTIGFGTTWNNTVVKANRTLSQFGVSWNRTIGFGHNWNLTTTQMNKSISWWAGWNASTGLGANYSALPITVSVYKADASWTARGGRNGTIIATDANFTYVLQKASNWIVGSGTIFIRDPGTEIFITATVNFTNKEIFVTSDGATLNFTDTNKSIFHFEDTSAPYYGLTCGVSEFRIKGRMFASRQTFANFTNVTARVEHIICTDRLHNFVSLYGYAKASTITENNIIVHNAIIMWGYDTTYCADSTIISNNYLRGMYDSAIMRFNYGVYCRYSSRVVISDNILYQNCYGIYSTKSSDDYMRVTGNYIYGGLIGVTMTGDFAIISNNFFNPTYANCQGVDLKATIYGTVISGNTMISANNHDCHYIDLDTGTRRVIISNNVFYEQTAPADCYGVYCSGSAYDISILGNQFVASTTGTSIPAYIANAERCLFHDNVIREFQDEVYFLSPINCSIKDNVGNYSFFDTTETMYPVGGYAWFNETTGKLGIYSQELHQMVWNISSGRGIAGPAGAGGGGGNNATVIYNSLGYNYPVTNAGLQSAIWDLNATAGGWVQLPQCNISITTIIRIPSGVWLRGAGNASVLYLADSADIQMIRNYGWGVSGTVAPLVYDEAHNIRISDLTLNGNAMHQTMYHTTANGPLIRHVINFVYVNNSEIDHVTIKNSNGAGIYWRNSHHIRITNCHFEDIGPNFMAFKTSNQLTHETWEIMGIWLGSTTNFTVDNCHMKNIHSWGIVFEFHGINNYIPRDGIISHCIIEDCGGGIWTEAAYNTLVVDCHVISATRWRVYNDTAVTGCTGFGATAKAKNIIFDSCSVFRCGNESGAYGGYGFRIAGENIVRNCVVNKSAYIGIRVDTANASILNNKITNTRDYGIYVYSSDAATVDQSPIIVGNKIYGMGNTAIYLRQAGSALKRGNRGGIVSNNIIGNASNGDDVYGIHNHYNNMTISGNNIMGVDYGILIDASYCSVNNNHIQGTNAYGIVTTAISPLRYNTFVGNTIMRATTGMFFQNLYSSTISSNTVTSCSVQPIREDDNCGSNFISNNMVDGNTANTITAMYTNTSIHNNYGYYTFFDTVDRGGTNAGYSYFNDTTGDLGIYSTTLARWVWFEGLGG